MGHPKSSNSYNTPTFELSDFEQGEVKISPSKFDMHLNDDDITLLTDLSVGTLWRWPCQSRADVDSLVDRIKVNSQDTGISITRERAIRMASFVGYDGVSFSSECMPDRTDR